jgi:hypothetical protein
LRGRGCHERQKQRRGRKPGSGTPTHSWAHGFHFLLDFRDIISRARLFSKAALKRFVARIDRNAKSGILSCGNIVPDFAAAQSALLAAPGFRSLDAFASRFTQSGLRTASQWLSVTPSSRSAPRANRPRRPHPCAAKWRPLSPCRGTQRVCFRSAPPPIRSRRRAGARSEDKVCGCRA